jgi:hypothetical protein
MSRRLKYPGMKFSGKDIYDIISKQTKCTKSEVKDVFQVYREIVLKLFEERDGEVNKLEFPNVGYFYFKKKHGAKAGTYRIPAWHGQQAQFITKEKDDPDYVVLAFCPYISIRKYMKNKCQGKDVNCNE